MKKENFRCSRAVIKLLNAFRDDVEQVPVGETQKLKAVLRFAWCKLRNPRVNASA